MYWSDYCRYMNQNARHIPAANRISIQRRALARYVERVQGGYARGPLVFSDLINEAEGCIAGVK
jgi:hypothetical protein